MCPRAKNALLDYETPKAQSQDGDDDTGGDSQECDDDDE